jgi:voltage-gated potassium channel
MARRHRTGIRGRVAALFATPLVTRIVWHAQRVSRKADGRFFRSLLAGLAVIMVVWGELGQAVHWSATTVLGQGDAAFVQGPVGWAMGWALGLFGVAIVATITGALVGFVIDFLLKEGQGMGAAGYQDHVVVCGWNATARDLVAELVTDDDGQVVLVHDVDANPATDDVYFVRGSGSNEPDLRRAGIEHARAAVVCPSDGSDQADMTST